jgi:hypothetical protein
MRFQSIVIAKKLSERIIECWILSIYMLSTIESIIAGRLVQKPELVVGHFLLFICEIASCCYSKSVSYLLYFDLNFLSNFSMLYKYYKSLNSVDTVSFSTDFCNLYFVFLTDFDWFCSGRPSVEASITTTAVTRAPTATITAVSTVTQ